MSPIHNDRLIWFRWHILSCNMQLNIKEPFFSTMSGVANNAPMFTMYIKNDKCQKMRIVNHAFCHHCIPWCPLLNIHVNTWLIIIWFIIKLQKKSLEKSSLRRLQPESFTLSTRCVASWATGTVVPNRWRSKCITSESLRHKRCFQYTHVDLKSQTNLYFDDSSLHNCFNILCRASDFFRWQNVTKFWRLVLWQMLASLRQTMWSKVCSVPHVEYKSKQSHIYKHYNILRQAAVFFWLKTLWNFDD